MTKVRNVQDSKAATLLDSALQLHAANPSWPDFYAAVFGVGGQIALSYPTETERREFQKSAEYGKIQGLLRSLIAASSKPQRTASSVVTVRMQRTLHDALVEQSRQAKVSLNALCLQRLALPAVENQE